VEKRRRESYRELKAVLNSCLPAGRFRSFVSRQKDKKIISLLFAIKTTSRIEPFPKRSLIKI